MIGGHLNLRPLGRLVGTTARGVAPALPLGIRARVGCGGPPRQVSSASRVVEPAQPAYTANYTMLIFGVGRWETLDWTLSTLAASASTVRDNSMTSEIDCLVAMASARVLPMQGQQAARLCDLPVPRLNPEAWILGYQAACRRLRAIYGWRCMLLVNNATLTNKWVPVPATAVATPAPQPTSCPQPQQVPAHQAHAGIVAQAIAASAHTRPIGSEDHHDKCLQCNRGSKRGQADLLMCDGCPCVSHMSCAFAPGWR